MPSADRYRTSSATRWSRPDGGAMFAPSWCGAGRRPSPPVRPSRRWGGWAQRLPRLVGLARARDLIYSGRRVGADEALSMGLVDRVSPSGQVREEATEAALRYAKGPTLALAAAKVALDAAALGELRRG